MTQGRIYDSEIGKGGFDIKAFCQQGAKSFTSHHSKKTRKKRCPLYSSLFAHPPGRRPRKTICGANEVSWPSASVSIFHCNTPRGQSFSFQAKLDFPLSYPKGHHLLAPSGALIAIPDLLLTHHPTFFRSHRSSITTLNFHFLSHYSYIKSNHYTHLLATSYICIPYVQDSER